MWFDHSMLPKNQRKQPWIVACPENGEFSSLMGLSGVSCDKPQRRGQKRRRDMATIKDHYSVYFKKHCIASYYIYSDGKACYSTSDFAFRGLADEAVPAVFKRSRDAKRAVPFMAKMMTEQSRVQGQKKPVYKSGDFTVERIPQETGEKFWVYRRSAEKGEDGYSEKDYSTRHDEGEKTPEGMKEWASWYCFNKMDDGTYEAELDEAWWWGGGHNDGGTIHAEIPDAWFALPYDEFLENVVTLAHAAHFGFTAEGLKEKKGLKAFFAFE